MLFPGGKKSTMLQKIIEKNQKFGKNGLGMCTLITAVVVGRAQTCSCWRGESTSASTAPNRCVCIFISDKKKTQSLQTTSILVVQMLRVVINSYSSGFSSLSFCSASLDQVQASLSRGMSQNRLCSGSLSSFWLLILLLLVAFV